MRLAPPLFFATASVKIALGFAAFCVVPHQASDFPHWLSPVLALSYAGAALLLLRGGQGDARARALGAAYLCAVTSYTDAYSAGLAALVPGAGGGLIAGISSLHLEPLAPYCLWQFAERFPRTTFSARTHRLFRLARALVLGWGIAMVLSNLAAPVADPSSGWSAWHWRQGRGYLLVLGGSVLLAIAALLVRTRHAAIAERRRVLLFATALLAGLGPLMLTLLAMLAVRPLEQWVMEPRVLPLVQVAVLLPFAALPYATGYSVLKHRVLDVRLIARRALEYLLARNSVVLAAVAPLAILCAYLVRHRHETVAELASGAEGLALLAATLAGALGLTFRRRLLDAIDRRFFRARYDARQLLTLLADQIRTTSHPKALADLLANGIDRALHLENIGVLVSDTATGALADPLERLRPLSQTSGLARLLARRREPLDASLKEPLPPVRRLPEEDRHWLADGGFELIAPLVARSGTLLGAVALGEKKSGLPFVREDRQLIAALAASASLALELWQLEEHSRAPEEASTDPGSRLPTSRPAVECPSCATLYLPGTVTCSQCRGPLFLATVPYVLPGKFRFERRLGTGGMGVVYRAADLALGRPVAVKTLQRVSPEDALRLRREAQTAAMVAHPNLAFIYGIETWRGTPMLILEFLEGGTLAERLERGALPPVEAVELGIAIAGALARLHAAEILHRDVKPSNIGFGRDGTPKLMDFGIAEVSEESHPEGGGEGPREIDPKDLEHLRRLDTLTFRTSERLVGTLRYLAPETFSDAPADASADLWGLSMVLFESIAGEHPFADRGIPETISAIKSRLVPDIRHYRPDCPSVLSDFFAKNLNRARARRAATAVELKRQLEETYGKLLA